MEKPINFFAASDLVQAPSYDYDGSRDEDIIEHRAYVYAEDEQGNRVRLFVKQDLFEAQAMVPTDKLASALNARLASGKLPVAFDRWQEARPAYGSPAYEEYGQQADLEQEFNDERDYMPRRR